jgi:nicotinamide-nucleotide amidase
MTETLVQRLQAPIDTLVQQVLSEACERRLRLATAESCTGGLLASVLTDVVGYSHAFERGFVVYTDEAKHQVLGVPQDLLSRCGAVSEAVAIAMAQGVLEASSADVAVSITGFAGRGGPGDQPGLVHFAAARLGRPTRTLRREYGDVGRERVRLAALTDALEMFRDQIV